MIPLVATVVAATMVCGVFALIIAMLKLGSTPRRKGFITGGVQTEAALADALGMTLVKEGASPSVLRFDGEVAGVPANLRITYLRWGATSMSMCKVGNATLEVSVPLRGTFAFESSTSMEAPAGLDAGAFNGLTHGYTFEGDLPDALMFFGPEVKRALNALWTRHRAANVLTPAWSILEIEESLVVRGLVMVPEHDLIHDLVQIWPKLVGHVGALVRAWPEQGDASELLFERVVDEDESLGRRLDALLILLVSHERSAAVERLRAESASLPGWAAAWCAMSPLDEHVTLDSAKRAIPLELYEHLGSLLPWAEWAQSMSPAQVREKVFELLPESQQIEVAVWDSGGLFAVDRTTRFELICEAHRSGAAELSMAAREVLIDAFPWATCSSLEVPMTLRGRAAVEALRVGAVPEDAAAQDATFSQLFGVASFANHLSLYMSLTQGGWAPSPDTLAALAPTIHEDALAHIVDTSPVGMLSDGRLSLAEVDETRGGLSSAAPPDGLELVEGQE